ncbi:MAG: hypothetical protein WC497_03350 [Patescibacteria group bacterium]
MHRLSVLCCIVLVAVFNASCAQATEPSTTTRGPVWAYGAEVQGEAWFEERDGVSYYQGRYQYWPRAHREEAPTALTELDLQTAQAYKAAGAVIDEASTAARSAATPSDWVRLYTQVLEAHRDVVISYEPGGRTIRIEFANIPIKCIIRCPVNPPARSQQAASDSNRVRQIQVDRFWKFYNNGSWIFWGSGYFTVIHPIWQAKTIAAIDSVTALKASGLSGDALTRAIAMIDVKNTALEEDNFLRDLIAIEGR